MQLSRAGCLCRQVMLDNRSDAREGDAAMGVQRWAQQVHLEFWRLGLAPPAVPAMPQLVDLHQLGRALLAHNDSDDTGLLLLWGP